VLLGVPATFLSVVDENRDFYLSQIGFCEPLSTTRSLSGTTFCHLAISNEGPLVIDDTSIDSVHRAITTVESLGVAAYLGVPVRLPDDQVLGSFCANDHEPRVWTTIEQDVMVELARSAERDIALAHAARRETERASAAETVADELRQTMKELERTHWHIRKLQESPRSAWPAIRSTAPTRAGSLSSTTSRAMAYSYPTATARIAREKCTRTCLARPNRSVDRLKPGSTGA